MLSRNHLLLVLLSLLNGAEWKLTEEERQVLATGTDGRLGVEAAVAVSITQESLPKEPRTLMLPNA